MPTDARLLTLMQLLSPAFPTGAFAYSHGIEAAIQHGWITDAASLKDWLRDCLEEGTGHTDAIWLRLAHATDAPLEIDAEARAFAMSLERLREAERQGGAFIQTVNAVWDLDLPPLLLPLAVGQTAARAGLDADETVALYLHAFLSNLVSAALRLMPFGQTEGQRILAALTPACLRITAATRGATLNDVHANTFLSDIAAMQHETLQPRLFQS